MAAQNVSELREKTLSDIQQLLPHGAPRALNTEKLAELIGVKPHTIHRALCVDGHYLGLVPTKLANGRLLFPIESSILGA